jgi:hypothetical protein
MYKLQCVECILLFHLIIIIIFLLLLFGDITCLCVHVTLRCDDHVTWWQNKHKHADLPPGGNRKPIPPYTWKPVALTRGPSAADTQRFTWIAILQGVGYIKKPVVIPTNCVTCVVCAIDIAMSDLGVPTVGGSRVPHPPASSYRAIPTDTQEVKWLNTPAIFTHWWGYFSESGY